MTSGVARRLLAESLGTAFLLAAVVGSGIAAQRLSPGDAGLQLLENAVATGAALVAIIATFRHVSGAHLNPLVTLVDRHLGNLSWREATSYCGAQVVGAIVGVAVANAMFELPPLQISAEVRDGAGLLAGEVVATLGLLLVVFGLARSGRTSATPFAVGAFISAAYFFTSSTGFANPAVTTARMLTDTFAGIAPASAPAFIAAEAVGAVIALVVVRALWPASVARAPEGIVPQEVAA